MIASGFVRSAALGAMAMFGALGCQAVGEAIGGGDVRCEATSEVDCLRIVELTKEGIKRTLTGSHADDITQIVATPAECDIFEIPEATRCWEVAVMTERGRAGVFVYQLPDGSFGVM